MTYVSGDGTIVKSTSWSIDTLFEVFLGFFNCIAMFFRTLLSPELNKYGSQYTRKYTSRSGPPHPSTRRMGGLNLEQSVTVPGGCSSCSRR